MTSPTTEYIARTPQENLSLEIERKKSCNTKKKYYMQRKRQERDLFFTVPCRHVSKKDGKYGCCSRDVCVFAHSLEELRIVSCHFGMKCTRRETNCYFIHEGESREEYYKRTGKFQPDLPPTSEDTRKSPGRPTESKTVFQASFTGHPIELSLGNVPKSIERLLTSGLAEFELVVKI